MALFQQGMECFLCQFRNEGKRGKKSGYIWTSSHCDKIFKSASFSPIWRCHLLGKNAIYGLMKSLIIFLPIQPHLKGLEFECSNLNLNLNENIVKRVKIQPAC